MKISLWICFCTLLPGMAGGQAAKTLQIAENNVMIHFSEPRTESIAREVLAIVASARQELTAKYQLALSAPVEIRLCATTYEFCQITGRPWWQASVYRNRVIYLQPIRVLRERRILATTLRHELVHQLVEEQSQGHSPAWLSEALAVYNSGEIALLKPARLKTEVAELNWNQLEKRLERLAGRAEAERLYFQLYHLGQFLETRFAVEKIARFLQKLGEKTPFASACQEIFGESAAAIEKSWLQAVVEKNK